MSAGLEAALARAAAVTDRSAEISHETPVDPAFRAALARACAASPSGAERAIGERVGSGLLTWDEVWRDPRALGPDGVRLVQRALVLAARDIERAMP